MAAVHHDQPTDVPGQESLVRHPISATVREAAHLREIVNEGENAATPGILVGAALAFVVPLAAVIILLAFGIAHFSG
jgi:cobalamin biosynthesis protein CobD/CbiB